MSSTLDELLRLRQGSSFSTKIPCFISVFDRFKQNQNWVHQGTLSSFLEKAMLRVCEDVSALEISGFSEAIIQSCLSASLNMADGAVRFRMRDELISLKDFLNAVATFIDSFIATKNIESNLAEELRAFASRANYDDNDESVQGVAEAVNPLRTASSEQGNMFANSQFPLQLIPSTDRMVYPILNQSSPRGGYLDSPRAGNFNDSPRSGNFIDRRSPQQVQMHNPAYLASHSSLFAAVDAQDYERAEILNATRSRPGLRATDNLTRLLAQVRKQGMDILFPQNTHDKVLACIFVAVRSKTALAHRELIDLVMLVRDSGKVSQLEAVTKTKIRGVLALLKHADVLSTHGLEGTPVQLALHPYIRTFDELRNNHDNFIQGFACKNKISCSRLQWQDVLWTFPADVKASRCSTITDFCSQLVAFYQESSWMAAAGQVIAPNTQASYPIRLGPDSYARVEGVPDDYMNSYVDVRLKASALSSSDDNTTVEGTPSTSSERSESPSSPPAIFTQLDNPAQHNSLYGLSGGIIAQSFPQQSSPRFANPLPGRGLPLQALRTSPKNGNSTDAMGQHLYNHMGSPRLTGTVPNRTDTRSQFWNPASLPMGQRQLQNNVQSMHPQPNIDCALQGVGIAATHKVMQQNHSRMMQQQQSGPQAVLDYPQNYMASSVGHMQSAPMPALRRANSDCDVQSSLYGLRSIHSSDSLLSSVSHGYPPTNFSQATDSRSSLWGAVDPGMALNARRSSTGMSNVHSASTTTNDAENLSSKSQDYTLFLGQQVGLDNEQSGYYERELPPHSASISFDQHGGEYSELDSHGDGSILNNWAKISPTSSSENNRVDLPQFFSSSMPGGQPFLSLEGEGKGVDGNLGVCMSGLSLHDVPVPSSLRGSRHGLEIQLHAEEFIPLSNLGDDIKGPLPELIGNSQRPFTEVHEI